MFMYLGWSFKAFGTMYLLPPQLVPISGLAHGLLQMKPFLTTFRNILSTALRCSLPYVSMLIYEYLQNESSAFKMFTFVSFTS